VGRERLPRNEYSTTAYPLGNLFYIGATLNWNDDTSQRLEQRDMERRLHNRLRTCLGFFLALLWIGLGLAVAVVLLSGCVAVPTVQAVNVESTITPTPTTAPTATPTPVPSPTAHACQVSTGYASGTVYVRKGPGMQYPVVDFASEGESLPVLDIADAEGWIFTRTQRTEGYFYAERWCAKERE
jgi:uncharacterized protein YgiM (DUF1202 family)